MANTPPKKKAKFLTKFSEEYTEQFPWIVKSDDAHVVKCTACGASSAFPTAG